MHVENDSGQLKKSLGKLAESYRSGSLSESDLDNRLKALAQQAAKTEDETETLAAMGCPTETLFDWIEPGDQPH